MKIPFAVAMVLLFFTLGFISLSILKRSRRGYWILFGILLASMLLFKKPVSDVMDPWYLASVGEIPVSEVVSGREFIVQGWLQIDRHIVLAGTKLPEGKAEQDAAKAGLLQLLGVTMRTEISFPNPVRHMPEPWPAIASISGVRVNEHLLMSKLLLPDGGLSPQASGMAESNNQASASNNVSESTLRQTSAQLPKNNEIVTLTESPTGRITAYSADVQSEKPALDAAPSELPTWVRYILWVLVGCSGATALGMVLNKRYHGILPLLLIIGFATRSIMNSVQSGVTVWPPIVCLIIIVMGAGAGRIANKQFLENNPNYRNL